MTAELMQELVARGATSLLDGILIPFLAWILLRLFGTRSSGIRFAVWFSALLAIASVSAFYGPSTAVHSRSPEIVISSRWANYLFLGWAGLVFVGLARIGAGLLRLRRMREHSEPLDLALLDGEVQRNIQQLRRGVSIRISDELRVPTAIGFFRAAVLLPRWTFEELSPEELNSVLLHELAHLRRWDDWTNLTQKVIRALLFFHPAVWWVDRRLSIEREMSCDDMVLAQSKNPRGYARSLVTVAERSFLRRPVALAQAAVTHVKHTTRRITKILDGQPRRAGSVWKPAFGALAAFMLVGGAVVEHTPQLVGFDDASPIARTTVEAPPFGGRVVPAMARVTTAKSFTSAMLRPRVIPAFRKKRSRVWGDAPVIARAILPEKNARPLAAAISDERSEESSMSRNAVTESTGGENTHVVNASAKQDAAPAFMLVVFQTQEDDGFGGIVVRTYVWRIRVPVQLRAAVGIDPRST